MNAADLMATAVAVPVTISRPRWCPHPLELMATVPDEGAYGIAFTPGGTRIVGTAMTGCRQTMSEMDIGIAPLRDGCPTGGY